jgi:hypothetical protein
MDCLEYSPKCLKILLNAAVNDTMADRDCVPNVTIVCHVDLPEMPERNSFALPKDTNGSEYLTKENYLLYL